jgi:hypothetical protein
MIPNSSHPQVWRAVAAAALALACQDPAKPLLTPSQVVGAWVLVLSASPACTSSGVGQQLHLDLALIGQSQSPTATVTGVWDFDSRVPPRYLVTGSIDFRTARLIASLWQQQDSVGSALAVLVGSYDAMQGQLTDPAPGVSGNFSGGSCSFDVTGHR